MQALSAPALRQSDGLGADGRPVEVERTHGGAEPLAFLADEIFRGDPDVVEEDRRVGGSAKAHLALMASERNAGYLLRFDDESADSVCAIAIAGPRHHHNVVGNAPRMDINSEPAAKCVGFLCIELTQLESGRPHGVAQPYQAGVIRAVAVPLDALLHDRQ